MFILRIPSFAGAVFSKKPEHQTKKQLNSCGFNATEFEERGSSESTVTC
tara:strand:- start:206 stop:352 length:147 start_codon:yes stop_codon:yes gene_type:complete